MREIKPKKTVYRGHTYRSMAEAKTAEALDRLGLSFEYECAAARGPQYVGGQYTPDFWVPDLNAYIEVAGVWDDRHNANTALFAGEMDCYGWFTGDPDCIGKPLMMMVNGDGFMHPIFPYDDYNAYWDEDSIEFRSLGVMLGTCEGCGELMLVTTVANWVCPHCGFNNNGDDNRFWERAKGNLFDAAGVKRYGGR